MKVNARLVPSAFFIFVNVHFHTFTYIYKQVSQCVIRGLGLSQLFSYTWFPFSAVSRPTHTGLVVPSFGGVICWGVVESIS